MKKILDEQRIVAQDQNKVFVERATARRLSAVDAESKYGLDHGKGMARVEFDIEPERLCKEYNRHLQVDELFIVGDVDLTGRNVDGFFNF